MDTSETRVVHWLRHGGGPIARRVRRAGLSALGTYVAYLAYGAVHRALIRPVERRGPALPGDDLVPEATSQKDFVATIRAPRASVFPWLVQMGWGRAGYYSWYPLDNGGVPSADHIVPALQGLALGDYVPDGPRATEGYGQWWVRVLERDRAMVLYTRREPLTGLELETDDPRGAFECSWAFVLDDVGAARTRLTVRVRSRVVGLAPVSRALTRVVAPIFDVGDTVMQWTLVEGIRARAEALARS